MASFIRSLNATSSGLSDICGHRSTPLRKSSMIIVRYSAYLVKSFFTSSAAIPLYLVSTEGIFALGNT